MILPILMRSRVDDRPTDRVDETDRETTAPSENRADDFDKVKTIAAPPPVEDVKTPRE